MDNKGIVIDRYGYLVDRKTGHRIEFFDFNRMPYDFLSVDEKEEIAARDEIYDETCWGAGRWYVLAPVYNRYIGKCLKCREEKNRRYMTAEWCNDCWGSYFSERCDLKALEALDIYWKKEARKCRENKLREIKKCKGMLRKTKSALVMSNQNRRKVLKSLLAESTRVRTLQI